MTSSHQSTAKRPYLLRAYYDWLLDNNFTPYLVVNADYNGVEVPVEYIKDGQIVLNLSPNAVGNLNLGNQTIQFSARFQGVARNIVVPLGAALAIYARENGDGVMFEEEAVYNQPQVTESSQTQPLSNTTPTVSKSGNKKSTAHLTLIR